MELHALISADYTKLLDQLSNTIEELCSVIDELAYTRSQELDAASLAWNGILEDSIQKRDRAAKYAAASITSDIYKLEASRDALIERKYFIIRLLDDHRQGLR